MKKIIMMIICLFVLLNTCFSQSDSTYQLRDYDYNIGSEKNPAIAFTCSLVIPGLGQIYNEDIGLGLILFGTSTVGATFFIIYNNSRTYGPFTEIEAIGFGVYIVSTLISIIEAPLASNEINKEVRRKKALLRKHGHSFGFILNDKVIGLDLKGNPQGIALQASWHL